MNFDTFTICSIFSQSLPTKEEDQWKASY